MFLSPFLPNSLIWKSVITIFPHTKSGPTYAWHIGYQQQWSSCAQPKSLIHHTFPSCCAEVQLITIPNGALLTATTACRVTTKDKTIVLSWVWEITDWHIVKWSLLGSFAFWQRIKMHSSRIVSSFWIDRQAPGTSQHHGVQAMRTVLRSADIQRFDESSKLLFGQLLVRGKLLEAGSPLSSLETRNICYQVVLVKVEWMWLPRGTSRHYV
jgi:hypothetical protein